jgi:hypothetical protein
MEGEGEQGRGRISCPFSFILSSSLLEVLLFHSCRSLFSLLPLTSLFYSVYSLTFHT